MRRIDDPRIRQTLNQISQNLEAANQATQASLFTFSQTYISPCLSSLNNCLEASCQPCFAAARGEHDRRGPHHRRQARGRESLAFDFYDDWEQDEVEWGNDELDRLLSGNDHGGQQPGKHGGMSYGSGGLVGRTKDRGQENDPNIVPQSSIFGFLERLPWKIGGRGRRYRPGVADLRENVGRGGMEAEPLIADGEDEGRGKHGRSRSGTVGSRDTTNSLSSRGDLFPSEDEDDAVPLDDEFAMVLERRTTGATSDDHSSKKKGKKRLSASRTSTKSTSTKETRSLKKKKRRGTSSSSGKESGLAESAEEEVPSMVDLKQEEERVRREEEAQVEERRQAAHRLARERGLSSPAEAPGDVKKGAIVQESQLLSPTEEDQPTINPPQESPTLPTDSKPSERPPSPKGNPDPEPPRPPDESS